MEYRLVAKSKLHELNQEVNFLLGEGWELYGDPSKNFDSFQAFNKSEQKYMQGGCEWYLQALIKPGTLHQYDKHGSLKINGQEWYDRFEDEFLATEKSTINDEDREAVLDAAKKAAGIE